MQRDPIQELDELLRARAILGCFIYSLADSQADDRYVLWTVDGILGDVSNKVEAMELVRA